MNRVCITLRQETTLLLTILLCLCIAPVHADEQKKVRLDSEHPKETIRLAYCNIFITNGDTDDQEGAKITVEVENLDESNILILFGHAYPEKELKRLSPSITFDKTFPGTKGHRNIETCQAVRNVVFVSPSDKYQLSDLLLDGSETLTFRLPIYIAKYKNKRRSKLLLLEKQVTEIEITVDNKPDENYLRLNEECESLIKEISRQTFCTNRKHKTSLKNQEARYITRIEKIKKEVDEIIARNNWFSSDRGYQRYQEIKQKVEAINLKNYEGDCGKHSSFASSGHSCKYDNLSLQQIYHKLDDYYKKIYNSSDRKAIKAQVIGDVNLLYRCCTDSKCKKHSPAWKNSEFKAKITDRYNRINQF